MTRAEVVAETFRRVGTDKWVHKYGPIYAEVDPRIKSVLEIGVWTGESMVAWHDLFPEALVYGLEINLGTYRHSGRGRLNGIDRVLLVEHDVMTWDPAMLQTRFDLVVDDGSHELNQQVGAWRRVWPFVRSGGLYVIEDVLPEHAEALVAEMAELSPRVVETSTDSPYDRVVMVRMP